MSTNQQNFTDDRPKPNYNNLWYVANDSDVVFVFVHGILSDSRDAWFYKDKNNSNNNQYWPALIRDDARFHKPAIFLGGYYTEITGGGYNMRDAANELHDRLKISIKPARFPVLSKPNILFITHSTGGIVVRHILTKHPEDFLGKNIGLLLIASPSIGSRDAKKLSWLTEFANNKMGQQLEWDHPFLDELDLDFRILKEKKKIPGLIGAEAIENHLIFSRFFGLWRQRVLVEKHSAGRYFLEPKTLPDTDHFSAVKPSNREHPAYFFLRTFYEEQFVPNIRPHGAEKEKDGKEQYHIHIEVPDGDKKIQVYFSNIAVSFLKQFAITADDIVEKIEHEFKGHPIYQEIDYQSIPIPLSNWIYVTCTKTANDVFIETIRKMRMDQSIYKKWREACEFYYETKQLSFKLDINSLIQERVFRESERKLRRLISKVGEFVEISADHGGPVISNFAREKVAHAENRIRLALDGYDSLDKLAAIEPQLGSIAINLDIALTEMHKVLTEFMGMTPNY